MDSPLDPPAAFRRDVRSCVAQRRNGDLLARLRRPGAAALLVQGFPAAEPRQPWESFAQLCMFLGNTQALRAVVEAGIPGITLRACCMTEADSQVITEPTVLDLPWFALDALDADALQLALELDPLHPSFTRVDPKRLGTLHYAALVKALGGCERATVERAVRCCEVLAARVAHAPCRSDTLADGLPRMFVVGRYDYEGTADLVVPLLDHYIAAGQFDIDGAMVDPNNAMRVLCTPLAAAIGYGNASLSRAIIDRGCDLEAARGDFPDVLAMAASRVTNGARRASVTHAAVAEALMRRRIQERARSSETAAIDRRGAAPTCRRRAI